MQTTSLDRFSRHTASALITSYQKHISPKKGFSCAHRVLHGGESCSGYIKRTILEQGLMRAIPLSRRRFRACKAASQVLNTRRTAWQRMQVEDDGNENADSDEQSQASKKIANGNFRNSSTSNPGARNSFCSDTSCLDTPCSDCDCTGLTDCGTLSCDGVSTIPDCSAIDCSGTDCSAHDCSAIDCSGADCSAFDCSFGSCS
ncbi:MAG TPA: membrane protein insertion efficiency factor YidD [Chroococcales cyanobacterium]